MGITDNNICRHAATMFPCDYDAASAHNTADVAAAWYGYVFGVAANIYIGSFVWYTDNDNNNPTNSNAQLDVHIVEKLLGFVIYKLNGLVFNYF